MRQQTGNCFAGVKACTRGGLQRGLESKEDQDVLALIRDEHVQ